MHFYKIKRFSQKIKFFFQRGKRGFSDEDILGIDTWFATVFPAMLRELNHCIAQVPQYPSKYRKGKENEPIPEEDAGQGCSYGSAERKFF